MWLFLWSLFISAISSQQLVSSPHRFHDPNNILSGCRARSGIIEFGVKQVDLFPLRRHVLSDKGVVRIKVRGNETAWVGNWFQSRAWPRHLVQSAERLIRPISCLYSILKSWSDYINEPSSVSVTIKTTGGLCWQVLRCLQFLPLAG